MAKRKSKSVSKSKRSGKPVIGYTKEGLPICLDEHGRVIVGEGCFTIEERSDGVEIMYDEEKCPVEVRERFKKIFTRIAEGGRTYWGKK